MEQNIEKQREYIKERAKTHTEQFLPLSKMIGATTENMVETSFELGMVAGIEYISKQNLN